MGDVPLDGLLKEFLDEHGAAVFREPAVAGNMLSDVLGAVPGLDAAHQRAVVAAVRDRTVARILAPSPELGGVWNEPRHEDALHAWAIEVWAAPCDRPAFTAASVGESSFGTLTLELCARLGLRLDRPMPTQRPIEAFLARAADGSLVRIAGTKVLDHELAVPEETGDRTIAIERGRSWAIAYTVSHAASGETLADRIAERGPASVWVSQAVMRNLCLAVADLHRHGAVHGGLGPDNALFDGLEQVVLADAGLMALAGARPVADDDVQALAELAFHVFAGHSAPRRHGNSPIVPLRELAPDAPVEFALLVDRVKARESGRVRPTARDLARALGVDILPSEPPIAVGLPSVPVATPAINPLPTAPPPTAPPPAPPTAPPTAPPAAPPAAPPSAPTSPAMASGPTQPPAIEPLTSPITLRPVTPPTEPPPSRGRTGRRPARNVWLVVGGLVAAAALVVGFLVTRGGAEPIVTDTAEVADGVADFESLGVSSDVEVERLWVVAGSEFTGTTVLVNESDDPVSVVYDEVIPDEIAESAEDVSFDPAPTEVFSPDPIARYAITLQGGDEFEITYTAALAAEPSNDDLAAWTDDWSRAYESHLDDPEHSPRDGDEDGVPDLTDDCADVLGSPLAVGCVDADGDTVPDDGRDECPTVLGSALAVGCVDADGDTVPDDGRDECPTVLGSALAVGCVDADGDTVPDDGRDECPTVLGSALAVGCVDADGDTVPDDGRDECPTVLGSPGAAGCADADADTVDDDADICDNEQGPAAASGCPDDDNDGVADLFDRCKGAAGEFDGCPDTDGDGFDDGADECADIPSSVNNGCPAPATTTTVPRTTAPGGTGGTTPTTAPPSNRSISLQGPSTAAVGARSDRFVVSANGFTPVSISWSNGSSGSFAYYVFGAPGTETVRVTVTDENGKSYSDSVSVTVT